MSLKRRHFLQFAGSSLAAIGLSQFDILRQGDRFDRVLAQSTPRKLALLVGINAYSDPDLPVLRGCLTDVDLQRELLIHRYGFNPDNILTLTDAQATRQDILTAFENHLIKQARPGDVAVFHFSGHGGRVSDQPDCDDRNTCLNSTFIPIDSGQTNRSGTAQVADITGHTLFLLTKAVQTDNFTAVLDSCHSGGGKRGNVVMRSRQDTGVILQPSDIERTYQQQWLDRLQLNPEQFIEQRRAGIAKGVIIGAARPNEYAADEEFSDFHAGLFTYLLTKYLWQQRGNEPIVTTLANVSRSTTRQNDRQNPDYEEKPNSNNFQQPAYFARPSTPAAEAVITRASGDRVEFLLCGIDADSLEAFERATFQAIDTTGAIVGTVQQESRDGLYGTGTFSSTTGGRAAEGLFLQEQIRQIPADFSLKVGLDPSLGSDRTQATSLLDAIDRITPVQQGEVDFLLGRVTAEDLAASSASTNPPAIGSISLFSPSKVLLPGSSAEAGETITAALTRLRPKLRSLLAARLLGLMENSGSSRLNVSVTLSPMGRSQTLAGTATSRGGNGSSGVRGDTAIIPTQLTPDLPQLVDGTEVQFRVENNEPRSLYVCLLLINAEGDMSLLYPVDWRDADDTALVGANQPILVPDRSLGDRFSYTVSPPFGREEVLVLASATPLRRALIGLQQIAEQQHPGERGPSALDTSPDQVIDALLGDIDEGTRGITTTYDTSDRGIAAGQLAAMSIAYQTVPATP